ncbi:tetratricopeptide repeat protein [Candidatus Gottesmanbacteria bacterium]|nr:tetratricopeptide repeat protein [Candidatus Gottesmanbacteria bacterium]
MNTLSYLKRLILREKLILIGLFVSVLVSFANAIPNTFVSDDVGAIVESKVIHDIWLSAKSGSGGLLESVTYRFFGPIPSVFHINNILIHFGVTLLVYLMLFLVSGSRRFAGVSAFFFAVHPLHTEAVTWISALPYILYTFFGLFSMVFFIAVDKQLLGKVWIIPAVIFLLLSFYSSEKAIAIPLLIGSYFLLFSSLKRSIPFMVPVCLATFLFLFSLFGRFGERVVSVNPPETGGTVVFNPLIQVPLAFMSYIKLFLWPIPLTLYHESFFVSEQLQFFLLVFLVLLAMGMVFSLYKNKLIFFGLIIFVGGLIPTLLPIQISWIVAERYMYLSSLGLIMVLSSGFVWVWRKYENFFWILFLSLFTFYTLRTIIRNADWYSQDTLWPATVAVSPFSSLAHNNMGDFYIRHGQREKAIEEFMKAIEIRPKYAEAYHNLGNTYLLTNDATKAAALFEQALRYNPTLLASMTNGAAAYIELGDYERAQSLLERSLQLSPNSPIVYNSWAVYYTERGEYQKAREMLQKALTLDPNFVQAKGNLVKLDEIENRKSQ